MNDNIVIKGARTNNLKNVTLNIPRDSFTVITGLSGSGKSSLAFDTIYAEGQRRYVESLSSYARQFLGQMEKPDVDSIEGLSPAISIDQKTTSKNPRSTVGTVTEIYDYCRLLWARVGVPHCPKCGKEIRRQTIDQMVDRVLAMPEGTKIQLLAPVIRGRKGEHQGIFADARKAGYVRARVDGEIRELDEEITLAKTKKHTIEIVVDRLAIKQGINRRLTDSMETVAKLSGGLVTVQIPAENREVTYSQNYACDDCGISMEEPAPRMFSFNSPYGACPVCNGLGMQQQIDPEKLIPDTSLSILNGAITAFGWSNAREDSISRMYYEALGRRYGFKLTTPVCEMSREALNAILYGTNGELLHLFYERKNGRGTLDQPFEGLVNNLQRRYRETQSSFSKQELEQLMIEIPCPECHGKRLKKEILCVTVGGMSIADFTEKSVSDEQKALDSLVLSGRDQIIAKQILKEIRARLSFLQSVGLSYLSLARASATLSGGESQRIRLATQIGSGLMGVLYILDEPSIGLHQCDNAKLIATLKRLRDVGNTLIVVEHDEETMRAADYIVDVGPGAGVHGGNIVAAGTPDEVSRVAESITGQFLSGKRYIPVPSARRGRATRALTVIGATEHNLKNIDVAFPLGRFTCVTGVSGSGKSSLVNEILYKSLASQKNHAHTHPGARRGIRGTEYVDKVIAIDQDPIGRTPRSNPATYTGLFNDIRELFASTQDAKLRGYQSGRFSFNVSGGRCEACKGDGLLKIEMNFLADIYVPCEACGGKRYNRETLEVRYKDKNIADVLDMTVEEAMTFFGGIPKIASKVQTLYDVGLGYIKLGQSSTTLSGGEAQRVKLATELGRRATGNTVYILDEPTTGLHSADVERLIGILNRLTDSGNTVIVIEHNLDVIKCADHIIDLGPAGGDGGGEILFEGTPEECAHCDKSMTGRYLKPLLKQSDD